MKAPPNRASNDAANVASADSSSRSMHDQKDAAVNPFAPEHSAASASDEIDAALARNLSSAASAEPATPRAVRSRWIRLLLSGEIPFVAAAILCGGAFIAGQHSVTQRDKVAFGEKTSVVLQTVLAHPQMSREEIEAQLITPIKAVLKKYAGMGYTVLDSSKDDAGNLAVVAAPDGAIDITAELRDAVAKAAVSGARP